MNHALFCPRGGKAVTKDTDAREGEAALRLRTLELQGFKSFPDHTVLTFDHPVTAIVGPNGSGKSTLLKCIYRVLKPTGGAVLLDGRDLDQYSYRESARRIAVVAQHNYYNFEFSVQDVVMMGRAPHKWALDRDNADDFRLVAEALELVGMSGFARRSFPPSPVGSSSGSFWPAPWPSRPPV